MLVEGLLEWDAACAQCGDEFQVDSLLNPYPDGLNCPTCRKQGLLPPARLIFTTNANEPVSELRPTAGTTSSLAPLPTADEDLEGPIDDPTALDSGDRRITGGWIAGWQLSDAT